MTLEQKITWILHLENLHKEWLEKVKNKLSIGSCSQKILTNNEIIGSLLEILYRVETFEEGEEVLNCLNDEEICFIKNKIVSLTENCSC